MQDRDYPRAILSFRNAVQAQPEEPEGHYQIALSYLSASQPREAIVALRKATEVNAHYAPAQLKLAELMIRTRDAELLKDAEIRVQNILTGSPGDKDALFTLAATQAQLGKLEDSEKYLNQVLAKSPSYLKAAIASALLKISQRDLPAAEQILKKAFEQSPKSADVAVALGILYAITDKLAAGESLLLKAVELHPAHTDALVALGALQNKAGKKQDAERTYKQLAAIPGTEHRLAYVGFLTQQNRRTDAILELERLARNNRDDRLVRSGLVAGYLAMNRPAEAESILREAVKKNSRDVEALLQRSQIFLRSGKYEEAESDLEEVIKADSRSAQGHYLRSKIFRYKGDIIRERQDLVEALVSAPGSLVVRLALADAMVESHNPKAALQTLDEAPKLQKRTLPFLIAHNWALIAMGNGSEARQGVNQALKISKAAEVLLQDGLLKFSARDITGARASVEAILNTNPENLRALGLLTQTYIAQNQRRAATERIGQFAAQRPHAAPLQTFWAQWLIENNRRSEARQALATARAADPKYTPPLLIQAGLDFNERKLNEARTTLKTLLRLEQRNTDALMLLAQVEEAANNTGKAIEHYNQLLNLNNRHLGALNNLAYALSRDAAKLDEALPLAQRAKELAPENAQIQDTLGWIYYRKGMYEMAARELEAALAKGERPVVQYHLGLTYNQLGNAGKGGRLLAAALAKEPKLAATEAAH